MTAVRWDEHGRARIVAMTNEAALQSDRWNTLVETIGATLGANGGALFTPALDPEGLNLNASSGTGADALPEFAARWAPEDPWLQALSRSGRPMHAGSIHFGDECLSAPMLFRTAFYNEFSKLYDIENIVSLKIVGDHEPLAPPTHLSFYQSRSAGSPFGAAQRDVLTTLWPHLQRAIHTHWALRKARDFDRSAEGALDNLPQPTWVLRDDLIIDHANRQARELMAAAPWLRTGAQHLWAIGDLDSIALREVVRSADFGGGRLWTAAIPMGSRLHRAILRVAPLRGVGPYATAWPHARALLTLELPPPDSASTIWMARLAKHYRLTPAECRVLDRLSAGLSPHEIAAEMGVSYTTTRAHLRALFDKTGCHRQADLVRLGVGA